MSALEDRVALVTGAGVNLGRAMALSLLGAGAKVCLTSLREDELAEVVAASGADAVRAHAIAADIGNSEGRARIVSEALDRFGHVDVLINNAAITPETFWPDWLATGEPRQWTLTDDFYRHFLEVNSVAPHAFIAALVPRMLERGWGRVVNVTTSLDTMLAFWPYGSAKAALEAQTASLAKQLEGSGVTANVLIPGGFTKPKPLHLTGGEVVMPAFQPQIMAAPVHWLASRDSDGVNARRILASRWSAELPWQRAWQTATFPIAWSEYGERAVSPELQQEVAAR